MVICIFPQDHPYYLQYVLPNFKFLYLVNNAHVCLYVKSSNGAWKSYQWSHPRKLMILFLPETTIQEQHEDYLSQLFRDFWLSAIYGGVIQVTTVALNSLLWATSCPKDSIWQTPHHDLHFWPVMVFPLPWYPLTVRVGGEIVVLYDWLNI